jgi:hypothetical protein
VQKIGGKSSADRLNKGMSFSSGGFVLHRNIGSQVDKPFLGKEPSVKNVYTNLYGNSGELYRLSGGRYTEVQKAKHSSKLSGVASNDNSVFDEIWRAAQEGGVSYESNSTLEDMTDEEVIEMLHKKSSDTLRKMYEDRSHANKKVITKDIEKTMPNLVKQGIYANLPVHTERKEKFKGIFSYMLGAADKASKSLEDFRLSKAQESHSGGIWNWIEETAKQTGATSAELAVRIAKLPVEGFGMVESIAGKIANDGVESAGEYYLNIAKNLMSFDGISDLYKGVKSAAYNDIKKGGLGITSTIIGSLSPSVFGELPKVLKIPGANFSTKDMIEKLAPLIKYMSSESGSVSIDLITGGIGNLSKMKRTVNDEKFKTIFPSMYRKSYNKSAVDGVMSTLSKKIGISEETTLDAFKRMGIPKNKKDYAEFSKEVGENLVNFDMYKGLFNSAKTSYFSPFTSGTVVRGVKTHNLIDEVTKGSLSPEGLIDILGVDPRRIFNIKPGSSMDRMLSTDTDSALKKLYEGVSSHNYGPHAVGVDTGVVDKFGSSGAAMQYGAKKGMDDRVTLVYDSDVSQVVKEGKGVTVSDGTAIIRGGISPGHVKSIVAGTKDSAKAVRDSLNENGVGFIRIVDTDGNLYNLASGGQIGTMVSGPGTGTSDSIQTSVQPGSYVIQAKYAQKANSLLNYNSGGQVPINISNGEMLLSPKDVQKIGGKSSADRLNKGMSFSSGGFIGPDMLEDETVEEFNRRYEEARIKYESSKKKKKGFFSGMFSKSETKPKPKQAVFAKNNGIVQSRNALLKEAAGLASGGFIEDTYTNKNHEKISRISSSINSGESVDGNAMLGDIGKPFFGRVPNGKNVYTNMYGNSGDLYRLSDGEYNKVESNEGTGTINGREYTVYMGRKDENKSSKPTKHNIEHSKAAMENGQKLSEKDIHKANIVGQEPKVKVFNKIGESSVEIQDPVQRKDWVTDEVIWNRSQDPYYRRLSNMTGKEKFEATYGEFDVSPRQVEKILKNQSLLALQRVGALKVEEPTFGVGHLLGDTYNSIKDAQSVLKVAVGTKPNKRSEQEDSLLNISVPTYDSKQYENRSEANESLLRIKEASEVQRRFNKDPEIDRHIIYDKLTLSTEEMNKYNKEVSEMPYAVMSKRKVWDDKHGKTSYAKFHNDMFAVSQFNSDEDLREFFSRADLTIDMGNDKVSRWSKSDADQKEKMILKFKEYRRLQLELDAKYNSSSNLEKRKIEDLRRSIADKMSADVFIAESSNKRREGVYGPDSYVGVSDSYINSKYNSKKWLDLLISHNAAKVVRGKTFIKASVIRNSQQDTESKKDPVTSLINEASNNEFKTKLLHEIESGAPLNDAWFKFALLSMKGNRRSELFSDNGGSVNTVASVMPSDHKGGGSILAYHNGGRVGTTGLAFLQQGEVVLPRGDFAVGGLVDNVKSSVSTGIHAMSIDTSKLEDVVRKLEGLELRVEEKEMKVEDKVLLVEDKVLTIEDKELSVEDKILTVEDKVFTVEDKVFSVDNVELKVEDKVFTVEDKVFKVEDKVFSVDNTEVTINTESIEASINKLTLSMLEGKNSVGAEKSDKLAQTLDTLNNQIIDLKVKHQEDITMVNTKINEKEYADKRVTKLIEDKQIDHAYIDKQISDVNSSVSELKSTQNRKDQELYSILSKYETKFNSILTTMNSIAARV